MDCLSNETLEWRRLHCDAVLYILYEILVQWNTGMKTAPLWCCLIHLIWDSCPMKHWNEDSSIVMLSYTFYMGFLSIYGILVQWNTGMKTPPLWCCLIHFIWDSCPMKRWNEDTSIVMLSYTFYIGLLVQWNTGMKTPPLWCCLIHFIMDCLSNETLEWRQLHCDVVLYILYWIACPMKHWNEDGSIVMLSYTFYNGLLVQWNTGMKTPPLWCCLIHFIWDSCPMKHWNEDSSIVMLSYTFYIGLLVQWNTGMKTAPLWCCLIHFILDCLSNETLEWRQLHCDVVLYILYWIACPMKHWNEDSSIVMLSYTFYNGLLVQWNTGMKTAPLWCCLIHFIWDSCPMKHWNEDSSIVMLSYTFYMGFLSNETLEWRHLHCDAVLYILYGILVQWSAGMKTPPLWCCLIHFILDCLSNETLEWRQLHCDVVLYIL